MLAHRANKAQVMTIDEAQFFDRALSPQEIETVLSRCEQSRTGFVSRQ
jgi:thymidine kinase